ncbi:succinylglutamate desuccinylase/aspartoacylase family protein [Pseudorhodoferax sp. Leaf274]|uniref:succinylglutamate desuccinylase/aspartoacylase domain-containing protein n=1 Tax=Pseudorhodoferax sp. Leaf274 TaxID=1736318 RepID=UPI000702F98C|nr:succinylglutamate desuccinylase/aspartoacylase family protein [Pseudorhodoferax sp. Leaf274]KQP43280.1 succinylglutamate desuccinylase [Pseudorhodoferax sp. Leaf274]
MDESLRLHSFLSPRPGARLVVLGGVHGDETCGTVAIERVRAELESGQRALRRGELTLVPVANPLARQRQHREGERNLNRSFRPDPQPEDYEARITNLLCPVLARHDVLLDLHSFHTAGAPFSMIGPRDNDGPLEPFARAREEGRLALHLGTPCVVEAWLDVYAARLARLGQSTDERAMAFGWGTNEYMRSQGGYAVTLECGQHRDPQAPEVAYRAILACLALLDMAGAAPPAPRPPRLLRLVDVVDRHADGDRLLRDWASFDPVQRGQHIGVRADGTVVEAPCEGVIVFPNPEATPGSEWFYLAVDSERCLDEPGLTPVP